MAFLEQYTAYSVSVSVMEILFQTTLPSQIVLSASFLEDFI